MEDEYFNGDLDLTATSQGDSFEELQEDDWDTIHSESETSLYNDDDQWYNEELLNLEDPSGSTNITDAADDKWTATSESVNTNQEVDESQEQHNNFKGSAISFTGLGRCECGCGSFGGHGDICSYCGHPYSAHSRYKK